MDNVNHPKHYTKHPSGVECIDITRHLPFDIGNAFKYVWRAGQKGDAIEDLNKAIWYLKDAEKTLLNLNSTIWTKEWLKANLLKVYKHEPDPVKREALYTIGGAYVFAETLKSRNKELRIAREMIKILEKNNEI